MAASKGINLVLKKGASAIAGVNAKKISYKGDPIEITGDDDSGYQASMPVCGARGLNFSGDGVTKNNILRDIKLNSDTHLLADITLVYPDGGIVAGDFFLSSYEESAETNDAIKFSFELISSGAWGYTAPTP
ncbi:MAG: phage tail tube protein [Pseudomonadota bacterium]